MNKDKESKVIFKILNAYLVVRRVRPNPHILTAHNETLSRGILARYNFTRVELKIFTFSSGQQSISIDNAVLGPIPKRLIFTMVKNTDFLGTMDSNPYNLRHYDINFFVLYVNGRQIPPEGLSVNMGHEKTSVMGYKALFDGSGIHHSNSGLQITHDLFIKGYFMLVFDLTPDRAASEGHSSNPENGHIRIEAKFDKALPDLVTCILYLEYDNFVRIDLLRNVTTDY